MFNAFEDILEKGLLKVCGNSGLLPGEILSSEDIEDKWLAYREEYMADAVGNFNLYPLAALAWAAFLGMGVAEAWDRDWKRLSKAEYRDYYGSKGWDNMDEHVLADLYHLNLCKDAAKKISGTFMSCAEAAIGLIRHLGIEAQTKDGLDAIGHACNVMFRIGETVGLKRLGYKKVAIDA